LLGHPFWGFLVVTAVLFVIAGVVRALQPTLIRIRAERLGIDAPPPDQETSAS